MNRSSAPESMNERLDKAEALFHEACERAPERREAFLREACAADADLFREVTALLRASGIADQWLKDGDCAAADLSLGPSSLDTFDEGPGTVAGRYKLLEKIGEGGFGAVYMADQHEPVRRKVALKIIKLGMDTKSVIARFEAERQALALMDHPNIAKVLDAGATDTGRPYFVMELVRGVPITRFCQQNQFDINQRLELFIKVCSATQHAHQKGVIHRDIKPTNVLVTLNDGVPHPMLIDFGVAKAINQRLTEKTLFTNFAQMIGTPAYMSPEQAEMSKLDVDTRSDVYSLGVLLYELLTGTTPFPEERLRSAGYLEMQRIICEEKPPRPSTQLTRSSGAQTRASRGARPSPLATDLDWIIMKCLEKDRTRRYETASGLAEDIQRHLHSQPVLARPPSRLYEFQKSVRRHKVGFAAAAGVILALAAGLWISSWQAARARQAEHQARRRAYLADMWTLGESLDRNRARARNLLEEYRPEPGDEDLRGFEWYYYNHLLSVDESKSLGTHPGGAMTLLMEPDGTFLTAGHATNWTTAAGLLQIWDGPECKLKSSMPAPKHALGIALSQDGKRLAMSRGLDIEIRSTDQPDRILTVLTNWHHGFKYRGWGQFLAFFNHDTELAIADWADSDQLPLTFVSIADDRANQPLANGSTGISGLAISRDGLRLAVRDSPDRILILDSSQGRVVCRIKSHGGEFLGVYAAMMFLNDARYLVSTSGSGLISLWDIATTNGVRIGDHNSFVTALALSPDGTRLASAGLDQMIKVWNPFAERPPVRVLRGHKAQILGVGFLPGGDALVSCSRDETVRRWDLRKPEPPEGRWMLPTGQQYASIHYGFLAATAWGKRGEGWKVWNLSRISDPVEPQPISPPPSMKEALVVPLPGTEYHLVWLEPNTDWARLYLYRGLDPPERVPDFPEIRTIGDGMIHFKNQLLMVYGRMHGAPCALVWDLTHNRELHLRKSHIQTPHAVAFASDGSFVVVGEGARLERLDLTSGIRDVWKQAMPGMLSTLAILPDNHIVLAGGALGTLRKLDFLTHHCLAEVRGSPMLIVRMSLSPSGTRVATGDLGGNVKLWDLQTLREVALLGAHAGPVTGLYFTPDGRSLLSTDNKELRVWRTAGR